jgi:hypothetical protein
MDMYAKIMKSVGFTISSSRKYVTYVKPRLGSERSMSDEDDEVFQEVSGKGVHLYKNPKELEQKLVMMMGSMKAGNTSTELKNDARSIIDEMLNTNYITQKQHKILYNKLKI